MAQCDESGDTRKVAFAVLNFLEEEYTKASTDSDSQESLEVAIQCLEKAFGICLTDATNDKSVSLRKLVLKNDGAGSTIAENKCPTTTNGASELSQLLGAAISTQDLDLGEKYVPPPEPADDEKKLADENKNKGNDEMVAGNFNEALLCYNTAIKLDGTKAVYFCNRAASFTKLERYAEALRDCQIACQLNPTYARAYGRMGVIYSHIECHREALQCYRKAVILEPENESYSNNLKITLETVGSGDASNRAPTGDGVNVGGPSLPNVFNSPLLVNMASQMLQDPAMQQMIRTFMTTVQNQGPSGSQSLESILQMGQAVAQQLEEGNPIAEQIESLIRNHDTSEEPNNS